MVSIRDTSPVLTKLTADLGQGQVTAVQRDGSWSCTSDSPLESFRNTVSCHLLHAPPLPTTTSNKKPLGEGQEHVCCFGLILKCS